MLVLCTGMRVSVAGEGLLSLTNTSPTTGSRQHLHCPLATLSHLGSSVGRSCPRSQGRAAAWPYASLSQGLFLVFLFLGKSVGPSRVGCQTDVPLLSRGASSC